MIEAETLEIKAQELRTNAPQEKNHATQMAMYQQLLEIEAALLRIK